MWLGVEGGGGGGLTITYLLKLLPQDVTHVQRIEHVRESIMLVSSGVMTDHNKG